MTKKELIARVEANHENARRGWVAAIVNAAMDPTEEAFANIDWYERRMKDLGILRFRVESEVEADK